MRARVDPSSYTPFHEALYDLRVREAMSTDITTLPPTATMREAQESMRDQRISGIPIIAGETIVGIVTIQDVIEALVKDDIDAPLKRWMTEKVVTVRDELPLIQAVGDLQERKYGRLPVVDKSGHLVGMLTLGDVTRAVMIRLSAEAEVAERLQAKLIARSVEASAKTGQETIVTPVEAMNLDAAGTFASQVKKALKKRGVEPEIVRRAAVASYEAEVNVILHSLGGLLEAVLGDEEITILVRDRGPGISNVEEALTEGFSTANEVVRALGFGAGMGLPNMRRCADEFTISAPASGTTITMKLTLRTPEKPIVEAELTTESET